MRIYGGHDYYDCGLAMGIDPTITLVRGKSDSVSAKDEIGVELPVESLELNHGARSRIEHVVVAFCDKLYHGVAGFRRMPLGGYGEPEYIWSAEKLRKWVALEKNLCVSVYVPWDRKKKKNKPELEEYFVVREIPEKMRAYMIQHRISILVAETPEAEYVSTKRSSYWRRKCLNDVEVNPATLKHIGFAKALDPFTAFQELGMWIGGVLGGSSPQIVTITDDQVLAENHGYDKHSFRSSVRP